jgi:hypothetical protein
MLWLFPLLIFLLDSSPVIARECYPFGKGASVCIRYFENGHTQAIEEFQTGKFSPSKAYYFYRDGNLMVSMDWEKQLYFHLDQRGELREFLDRDNYRAFEDGQEITDCLGTRCQSSKFSFVNVPTVNLQTGDVIFTGDVYPYSGFGRSAITHLAIFAGLVNGKPSVLTNDMYQPMRIQPFHEIIYNTVNFVILRNPQFQIQVKNYLGDFQPETQLPDPFCTTLYHKLLSKIYPEKTRSWSFFEAIHPEILLFNSYEKFEIIDLHLPGQISLKDLAKKRQAPLRAESWEWDQIIKEPDLTLYQFFYYRFAFLPLEFTHQTIEKMTSLLGSGIFEFSQAARQHKAISKPIGYTRDLSPLERGTPIPTKIASEKTKGMQGSRRCYKIDHSPLLCTMNYKDSGVRLIELFRNGGDCPDQALYFSKQGFPRSLIDWTRQGYVSLSAPGFLRENLSNGLYSYFEDQKKLTECKLGNCQSRKVKILKIPTQDLQPGDVIFSGNLYPYSGRGRSKVTHIAIFTGYEKGLPMILTNDIHKKLETLPLKKALKNTFFYAILRNKEFQKEFQALQEGPLSTQIPVPYFCANLFVKLCEKIFPEQVKKWDSIDRNFAEQIFLNSIPFFRLVSMNLGSYKDLKTYVKERTPEMQKIRKDIRKIMETPETFLEQLFQRDFPMLPIPAKQRRVHEILQFMKIHHPWDPSDLL